MNNQMNKQTSKQLNKRISSSLQTFFLAIFFPALMLASCVDQPQNTALSMQAPQVIYGDDDRLEDFEVEDLDILSWADSTVALINSSAISKRTDGNYDLRGSRFAQQYNLCEDEPFREQKSVAFCSGSLVAEDIVMTAGHCINATRCGGTSFVFDFAKKTPSHNPYVVEEDSVYRCKEIIVSHVVNTGADYALVRLDRPVQGRIPLALNRRSQARVGQDLTVIGHPSGLPRKTAGNAIVRSIKDEFYVTTLDTYGGNSGSAVFNTDTGEVEGILVRGETDFVLDSSKLCRRSKVCDEDKCRGEDVTKVSSLLEELDDAIYNTSIR